MKTRINKEWILQVAKDIAPKLAVELHTPIATGIVYSALSGIQSEEPLQPLNGTNNDWSIVSRIDVANFEIANKIALQSLQFGAECLHFYLTEIPNSNELSALFFDIECNWIQSYLFIEKTISESDISEIHSVLLQFNPSLDLSRIRVFSTIDSSPIRKITFSNLGENENSYKEWALQILDLFTSDFRNLDAITFYGNSNILWNIVQLRALRFLILRMLEIYDQNQNELNIHFSIDSNCIAPDPYQNLISTTTIGMSGILASVDSIEFPIHKNVQNEEIWILSSIQAQYILKEESKLNKVIDPLYGSHAIEEMTETLCEKIWQHIKESSNTN